MVTEDVLIASLKRYVFPVIFLHPQVWRIGHSRPPQSQSRKSTETRFDATELKQACLLINTADYCQTTAVEVRVNQNKVEVLSNFNPVRGENQREDQWWLQGKSEPTKRTGNVCQVRGSPNLRFWLHYQLNLIQCHLGSHCYPTARTWISMWCCFFDYGSYDVDRPEPS